VNCGLEINRYPQLLREWNAVLPGLELTTCFAQNPPAERHDEPGLFRDRNEVERRNHSQHRVLPSHERFEADDLIRRQRHNRLVQQQELSAFECAVEVVFELEFGLG